METFARRNGWDIVNESDAPELERILREYGEERHARRIARAIVEWRGKKPFATTKKCPSLMII